MDQLYIDSWKEKKMTGWKTKWGGITAIIGGLGLCMSAITFDPFCIDGTKFAAGVTAIGGGLELIGVGHKIEKSGK